jgi:hypothetical protein
MGSARYPHPAQNAFFPVIHTFIRVTSRSSSSSACTRSWRGMSMMRKGTGVRPDEPSYSSREMGSLGNDRISKAHSNREIASHSSRSATWMPGQMRRLWWQKKIKVSSGNDDSHGKYCMYGKTIHTRGDVPRAECPVVPIHGVW